MAAIAEQDEFQGLESYEQRVHAGREKIGEGLLEVAEALYEAHQLLAGTGRDGRFGPWVDQRLGYSRTWAYQMIDVARSYRKKRQETLHFFEEVALRKLAGDDPAVKSAREAALKLAKRQEFITSRKADQLLSEARHELEGRKEPAPGDGESAPAPEPARDSASGGSGSVDDWEPPEKSPPTANEPAPEVSDEDISDESPVAVAQRRLESSVSTILGTLEPEGRKAVVSCLGQVTAILGRVDEISYRVAVLDWMEEYFVPELRQRVEEAAANGH